MNNEQLPDSPSITIYDIIMSVAGDRLILGLKISDKRLRVLSVSDQFVALLREEMNESFYRSISLRSTRH